ncbi:hypothetical protein PV327_004661 [Microctonus hyperodae]|uniref:Uncharacterized protein n=2 Tax=Apocrita TaxID=7400 RepID=A0AA39FCX3_MICHY|nr:hypothetical protein PV327_004661 [Microctonus hyperodae]
MSCSVKISGKGWANPQRRIGSLPEETSTVYPPTQVTQGNIVPSVSTPTLVLNQQQQQQQQLIKLGPTPRATLSKSIAAKKGEDTTKLLKYIDDNVIGKNGTFFGPFGRRKGQSLLMQCDLRNDHSITNFTHLLIHTVNTNAIEIFLIVNWVVRKLKSQTGKSCQTQLVFFP